LREEIVECDDVKEWEIENLFSFPVSSRKEMARLVNLLV
jgi:hypothetical protein